MQATSSLLGQEMRRVMGLSKKWGKDPQPPCQPGPPPRTICQRTYVGVTSVGVACETIRRRSGRGSDSTVDAVRRFLAVNTQLNIARVWMSYSRP